ncbi:MAG: RNA polymerase factor sigma-54 [Parvularculaceae bacterium]
MAIAQKLELRQGQALVMTPQLQQAIKLLQYSNLELANFVEEELQKNPLLERDDGDKGDVAGEADAASQNVDADAYETGLSISEDGPSAAAENALDADYESVYADASKADMAADIAADMQSSQGLVDWSAAGARPRNDDGEFAFDATLTRELTLREHLAEQLQIATPDPHLRLIGAHLIDVTDEAGYLTLDLPSIADRLGTDLETVERALAVLQTFEPTGVCARNLRECLRLQLAERDRLDPAMECFLDNIELVAKHDLSGLMRKCGVDKEDVVDMIAEIRTLNPKPGLAFGGAPVQPVTPDVFVRPAADGAWNVELNSDTLPRVLVNAQYYAQVASAADGGETKAYLTECLNNANWLVKSLDQRARTILKVASEIVKKQDAFLVHGVHHLKPLNLRMVAEAISMHESTVSRVTSNKYIATPRGVFELKYFFTTAIASSAGGEAHSSESVRHLIKELVDGEPPEAVYSDDRIVEILRSRGVDIARRTVAKYREALGIPSSVQRRRQKRELG